MQHEFRRLDLSHFISFSDDLANDDFGLLCSFGAGYSIGSVILKKFVI